MRVLHIYKDYPPVVGGIEGQVRELARAQAAQGLEVTVLVTNPGRRSRTNIEDGVRVIRAGRLLTVASTPVSFALARFCRRERADVTHVHFPYPFGELAQRFFGHSRARIVTYHCDIVRWRRLGWAYSPMVRSLLEHSARVLVSSEALLRSSQLLGSVRANIAVIAPGVDPDRFSEPFATSRPALLEQRRLPVVLFVGRLRPYKGLDVLIESMGDLPAELIVVGTGPEESRCKALAGRSSAASRIHFAGEVGEDELGHYYRSAALLALPSTSRAEAWGIVQLEAMASSLPVVSTEVGTGTSVANRDGETGLVVPPNDADALRLALASLLGDPGRRAEMGRRGRERVVRLFHIDGMVQKVTAVYREALDPAWRR